MAKSLKIQIEMAGAEEIKRQLEGVGVAGEEAFNKIVDAAKKTGSFKELDPSFLKQTFDDLGTKAPEAIGKITQAVKSASRMETLVNALTGVEKGLTSIQAAATAMDSVLAKQLVRSLTMVARVLPAAFSAAVIGSIANTTKSILELDKAAIQVGTSIGELAKAKEIFQQIGLGASEAAKAAGEFFEKFQLDKVKEAIAALDEFGRPLRTNIDAMRILQEAANGVGEAADLARKALEKFGRAPPPSRLAEEIDRIRQSSKSFSDQLLEMLRVFEKMGNTAERNGLILRTFGKDLGTAIIQMLNAGISIDQIRQKLAGLQTPTQAATDAAVRLGIAWQRFKNFMLEAFSVSPEALDRVASTLNTITTALQNISVIDVFGNTLRELQTIGFVLTSIADFAMTMWDGFVQSASTAIQSVLQFFSQMPQQIIGYFAGFGDNLWSGIVSAAQSAWDTIVGYIQEAINKVKDFFSMGGGQATAGADAGGFARGGLMGGRGSGTSDSNLAWVSRGEHIMPAYAVRQPGVLQLLEALRRSGGNLRGVLDRMGHFAMGGMVSAPAFATGGMVGGMSHVTIQFPGLAPITGLRASSAVVDDLRRSAALAQVRSGGRKPTRYI